MIVYAVVDDALSPDYPLGDALEAFIRRDDAESFIEEVRGDEPGLAATLCAASAPGSVLVSEGVHEAGSSQGFAFTEVDRRQLEGFAEPVRAFEFRGAISDQEN
jgi:class 3 adenylate cyclase